MTTTYDNAPTDPHHGGKVWEPDPAPHLGPEKSFTKALEQMGRFNRRNLAAALEDFEASPNLDALGHASDAILEALDRLCGEMEMDADGVPTERVDWNRYEDVA